MEEDVLSSERIVLPLGDAVLLSEENVLSVGVGLLPGVAIELDSSSETSISSPFVYSVLISVDKVLSERVLPVEPVVVPEVDSVGVKLVLFERIGSGTVVIVDSEPALVVIDAEEENA